MYQKVETFICRYAFIIYIYLIPLFPIFLHLIHLHGEYIYSNNALFSEIKFMPNRSHFSIMRAVHYIGTGAEQKKYRGGGFVDLCIFLALSVGAGMNV